MTVVTAAIAALTFAFSNPFGDAYQAIVSGVIATIDFLHGILNGYGWAMLALAFVVKVVLYPLTAQQYKSMKEMQAIAPYVKRLQQRYKDDKVKLQQETMALYKEHGVNPLAGCLPILVQYPILIAIYQAIARHHDAFSNSGWLWIGSAVSHQAPKIFATSLAAPDLVLLVLYAGSMYFAMKITPVSDPQQQAMMNTQAIFMPLFLLFLGYNYKWMSAFVLYWFGFNVLSMAQQWWVMRGPSRIPAPPQDTPATLAGYPRNCPNCGQLLVVAKGSKCEACGVKVKKFAPQANGVVGRPGAPAKGRK